MMETLATYSLYGLLVANVALLFAASRALFRFECLMRRNRAFWEGRTDSELRAKTHPDAVLSGFLEHRLALLQQRVEELADRPIPTSTNQASELPFEHAARMAKFGASVEELTRTCGLNEAEAKLTYRIHAGRRAIQPQ